MPPYDPYDAYVERRRERQEEERRLLEQASQYNFDHVRPTPRPEDRISYPPTSNLQSVGRGYRVVPAPELRDYQQETADWLADGVTMTGYVPAGTFKMKVDETPIDDMLLEKVFRATDNNVNIQRKTENGGRSFSHRIYCHRCKTAEDLKDTKVLTQSENVSDEIVIFCIKHRHDGGGKSLAVLEAFNKQPDHTPQFEGGRYFREEGE